MRNILGLIALGLSFIASPLAAQTTASTAQGVRLNQTITRPARITDASGARVNLAVETVTSAAASPGGPAQDNDRADVNETISLAQFGTGLRERLVASPIVTSTLVTATQANSTAQVNDLAFSLGTDQSSLLSITALRVQSSSSATTSPLDTTGRTIIDGLQLTGSVFGPSGRLVLTLEQQMALAAGTPNIVVFNQNGLRITLNQQVETDVTNADGSRTLAIATDAIAVQFTNFAVGDGVKNGALVIASSSASATAAQVPISPQ